MDPAVYARAHGVQSEANNITVTRVACGEIMYRRAVDTYRRDMKYKLNNLRKEQKRLRLSMRGYRRKLRESNHGEVDGKVRTIGRSHNMQTSICDNGHKYGGQTNDAAKSLVSTTNVERFSNAASAALADKISQWHRNETKNESAQSWDPCKLLTPGPPSGRIMARDQPTTKDAREEQTTGETMRHRLGLVENVGKTVRKGSGKVGAASRQVYVSVTDSELEDDAFSVMSDSSDEDMRGFKKEDDPIDVVSFINGRFVREVTPMTLMKRSSAYFKAIVSDQDKQRGDFDSPEGERGKVEEIVTEDDAAKVTERNTNIVGLDDDKPDGNKLELPTFDIFRRPSIPLSSKQLDIPDQAHSDTTPTADNSGSVRKRKRRSGVSFNDLMKLEVSNNTKTLFSLVDRLARNNGVPVTPVQRRSKERLARSDPRETATIMRRARAAAASGVSAAGLATHGSVYYAIEFGYVSDADDSGNLPGSSLAESASDRECLSTLTPGVMSTLQNSHNGSSLRMLTDKMSSVSLSQEESARHNTLSYTENANGRHASIKSLEEDAGKELALLLSEQKEKHRDQRKESILEASNFVSDIKRKRKSVVNAEHAKRERELFYRQRRDSIKPEHVEIPHEHKEPWSSAFRRIKAVHTLVDLTHII